MATDGPEECRHESVDHINPTDAGMMEPDPTLQPASGVMGDETLVRLDQPGMPPYPGIDGDESRRGADPHPGPTQWKSTGEPRN